MAHGVALAAGLSALLASAAAYTAVKLAGAGYLLYCSDWSSGGLSAPLPPETHQIRCLVLCVDLVGSRRIWPAHVGCLVDPDGSSRIVWMIKRMIKQGSFLVTCGLSPSGSLATSVTGAEISY